MNDVIKIEYTENETQMVDARDLHRALDVQTDFKDWIVRRIEKFGFRVGIDFCSKLSESTGGRPAREYLITLNMAKELCMVENNEKGRVVRQFFIKIEEAWNRPEMVVARALKIAHKQLEEWKPKVLAFETFLSAKNAQSVGVVAKMFGMGRNRFFQMLRDAKILMSDNIPYQDYMKYFEVIDKPIKVGDEIQNKPVTLITPAGIEYLGNRFGLVKTA